MMWRHLIGLSLAFLGLLVIGLTLLSVALTLTGHITPNTFAGFFR